MADSLIQAVAAGVAPSPHTRLQTVTFTYSNGTTLELDGESAQAWFSGYLTLLQAFRSLQEDMQQPRVASGELRDFFQKQGKKSNDNDKG